MNKTIAVKAGLQKGWHTETEMIIIFILILLSLAAFILYGIDKQRALHHKWRISEATLLVFSFFGGIGGLLGMIFFHHKTRKWKFRILVPIFAIMDIVVLAYLLYIRFVGP